MVTWIEVRPRPGGASHGPVSSSSVVRGGGRLQGLHGEAVREQVGVEFCAGSQLRDGENRRHVRKESCPSEYLWGKASCPKVQCNAIRKYLLSNSGGSGIGLHRESMMVTSPILITPGRGFWKVQLEKDWTPLFEVSTSGNPVSYYASFYLLCI